MARPKQGEGSEVISISFPKEIADLIRLHPNQSQVVTEMMLRNIDLLENIDFVLVDQVQKQLMYAKMKKYVRKAMMQAVSETVEEIAGMSWEELQKEVKQ